MRRLVYEMVIGQRFLAGPLSEGVKSVEVIDILRFDKNEASVVCRVEFKDPDSRTNRIFDDDVAEVNELDRDGRVQTFFVRRRLPEPPRGVNPWLVYLSMPWRVENGVGRATCVGNAKEIKELLGELEKTGMKYRIVSLSDARFTPGSLLKVLTRKQLEVIRQAFKQGYYDIPRRTGSDELAQKLGMSNATFVAHRRKAERRLLAELLAES